MERYLLPSVVSDFPNDPDFHPFDGFSLYYSAAAPVVWPEQSSQQVMVLIPWDKMSLKLGGSSKEQAEVFEFTFPEVSIIPPGQTFSFQLSNPQPLMVLCLEPKSLLQGNRELVIDSRRLLVGQYGVRDSMVQFVATVLRDRHLEQSPENASDHHASDHAAYCRALVVFLLIHLVTTYRPNEPRSEIPKQARVDKRLDLILHYIEKNLDQELKVAALAEKAELSSPQFCRIFKKSTGLSPHRYILLQRIDRAKELLERSTMSLSDIALDCGFYDQSHFNLQFRNFTGITPKAYRDTH